ncbi:MAG: hypothetical protein JNK78_03405 [Planctomycetes bacterium]|nr:hypothetical protein [Planctomycetota bacterium]
MRLAHTTPALLVAALFAVACATATAQEPGVADAALGGDVAEAKLRAVAAYDAWCAVRDPWDAARRPLLKDNEELRKRLVADGLSTAEMRDIDERLAQVGTALKDLDAHEKEMRALRKPFIAAFQEVEWSAWDPKDAKQAALLDDAMMNLITETARDDRGPLTIRVTEYLLGAMPEGKSAGALVSRLYPLSVIATAKDQGRPEAALPRLQEAFDRVGERGKPGALMWLAEYHARAGNVDRARDLNQQAWDAIPAVRKTGDPRGAVKELLEMRMRLVGKAAPGFHVKERLGTDREQVLVPGRVTVLTFFNSSNRVARGHVPHFERLLAKYGDGLQIAGICRRETRGFLPASREELAGENGTPWRAAVGDDAEFLEHLRAFRAVAKPVYPWFMVTNADFEACGIEAVPAFAVVDTSGRVTYARLGGDLALLEDALDLAFAAKR